MTLNALENQLSEFHLASTAIAELKAVSEY